VTGIAINAVVVEEVELDVGVARAIEQRLLLLESVPTVDLSAV
jgi:hypothetical protein